MFVNGKYVLVSHDKRVATSADTDCKARNGYVFYMQDRQDMVLAQSIGGT